MGKKILTTKKTSSWNWRKIRVTWELFEQIFNNKRELQTQGNRFVSYSTILAVVFDEAFAKKHDLTIRLSILLKKFQKSSDLTSWSKNTHLKFQVAASEIWRSSALLIADPENMKTKERH